LEHLTQNNTVELNDLKKLIREAILSDNEFELVIKRFAASRVIIGLEQEQLLELQSRITKCLEVEQEKPLNDDVKIEEKYGYVLIIPN